MPITLEQAKALNVGDIVYHRKGKNADGTPMRWRVSGKVKTWKLDEFRVKVPIKHGLYDHSYVECWVSPYNESIHCSNLPMFTLDPEDVEK